MNDKDAYVWAINKVAQPGYRSDGGCTMSPDFNFKECCLRHDVMMNYKQGIDDRQAHRILRKCIASKGHPVLAWVYWSAVTAASNLGGPLNVAALVGGSGIFGLLYYFG